MTDYTDLKRRGLKVWQLAGQYDEWGMIDPDTEQFGAWEGDWVKAEDANAAIAALEAERDALRVALGGADSAMKMAEGVVVSKRELFALAQARKAARAALTAS